MEVVLLKPIVQVKNAFICVNRLFATPINHHNPGFNGKQVCSSSIVKVDGDRVETENTVYQVVNWD